MFLHTQIRILRDQYSYLQNDVPEDILADGASNAAFYWLRKFLSHQRKEILIRPG